MRMTPRIRSGCPSPGAAIAQGRKSPYEHEDEKNYGKEGRRFASFLLMRNLLAAMPTAPKSDQHPFLMGAQFGAPPRNAFRH